MKTIWKYELNIFGTGRVSIMAPINGKILYVGCQNEVHPVLWIEVNSLETPKERIFKIYGTGHSHDESVNQKYIGTVFTQNSQLVWHIYEEI